MNYLKWLFICGTIVLAGCSPKTNDGIVPTLGTATNGNLPNPFTLYNNGILAAGITDNVDLPPPYTATTSDNLTDTNVLPLNEKYSMSFGVGNFNPGGNNSSPTGYWASFVLVPAVTVNGLPVTTVNISSSGFSQATFEATFVASAGVTYMPISFGAAGNSASVTLTANSWASYSVPLGNLTAVSQYFVIALSNATNSAPMTVYVDDLVYQ
jgi:hypothetical protein